MKRSTAPTSLAVLIAALALPAGAHADTLFASPTGSTTATACPADNRCSIQNAVENVARTDDIVEAAPGNYDVSTGTLTLTHKITLRGQPGAAHPRIVGTSHPLGVAVAGAGATIQDVTVDLVGTGTAVVLAGPATIERTQILARGPGVNPADADALFSAAGGTLRDTSILVTRSPAATSHPSVTSDSGVLTLRDVTVTRADAGDEPAVGLGTGPGAAIDADGLVIEARRCLTLGGPGHSVIHDLTATQRGPNVTTAVVASGTTQIDGAVIRSTADQAGTPAALITGDATLSDATVDAPAGEGVRLDGHGRLDRARVTGLTGIDMFGAATVTNSLASVTGNFAGRYGGPGPTARVVNSTLVGESGSSGFRKDAAGTVELLNTIVSAGNDIRVNAGAVAASHSRFAPATSSPVTDRGGNIAAGPRFVDPTVGDFRLQPDSPMIDAGETHDLLGPLDLAGLPRVSGPSPDIGAFEFQHPAPAPAVTPAPSPEQTAQVAGPATTPTDALAPVLGRARLAPRRFPAGSRAARLQFTLSEPATLAIAVAREQPGRRSGQRCLKPSRKLRKARRCTRLVTTGKLKVVGSAGANSVPFPARGLRPGSYRLTIVPTDAAGNRGKPATARFQIAARTRKR